MACVPQGKKGFQSSAVTAEMRLTGAMKEATKQSFNQLFLTLTNEIWRAPECRHLQAAK